MGKFNKILWESNSDLWITPQEFYDELDEEFHFTLDPCSTDENAKCKNHFTIKENGLLQDWKGHNVFCNPPYSQIKEWVEKCYAEGQKTIQQLFFLFLQELIQDIFMIIYGKNQK